MQALTGNYYCYVFLWIRSRLIGVGCSTWGFDLMYISILSILRLSVPLCGPEGAFADYAFLIDASSSVLPSEFDILKTFVKRVIDFLQIGPNQTHVGVIEYSKGASLQLNFSRSYDKREIKSFVEQVPHTAGITRIDLALKVASEQLFTLQEGMRDDSRKVKLSCIYQMNSTAMISRLQKDFMSITFYNFVIYSNESAFTVVKRDTKF